MEPVAFTSGTRRNYRFELNMRTSWNATGTGGDCSNRYEKQGKHRESSSGVVVDAELGGLHELFIGRRILPCGHGIGSGGGEEMWPHGDCMWG